MLVRPFPIFLSTWSPITPSAENFLLIVSIVAGVFSSLVLTSSRDFDIPERTSFPEFSVFLFTLSLSLLRELIVSLTLDSN